MAAKTAVNPRWRMSDRDPQATIRIANVLHHSATVYYPGEFLRINSSGLIVQASTSAASGVAADAIMCFALQNLTAIGNSTTTKPVGVVHEDDIFEINELNGVVTQAMIGQQYGMNVTSHLDTLDVDITSHKVFDVVDPKWARSPLTDTSADTLANLYVKVMGTAIHAARVG